jgi:hypothetical protein
MRTIGSRFCSSPSSAFFETSRRDEADRLADLDRGEADARRVVHRLQHVVGELADFRRDLADRRGNLAQH